MIVKITCPACNTDGSISLADAAYEGPYRCWKCRGLFTLKMNNREVISCEPLSQEDFEKQQEADELRKKFKNG